MLLAIDISNTSIKAGIFQGTALITHWRLATDTRRLVDDYAVTFLDMLRIHCISVDAIQGIVVSCVVPNLRLVFQQLTKQYFHQPCFEVTPHLKLRITLDVENPSEVGADRIATTLGAHTLYGGPAIVITFGTATVFDCLDANGQYLGGAITPGVTLAMDALAYSTALLYQVDLIKPISPIGRNTKHMLQSGIVLGWASLVSGMVGRFKTELGHCTRVIASGWWAKVIMPETALAYTLDPSLLLQGLRILYEDNH